MKLQMKSSIKLYESFLKEGAETPVIGRSTTTLSSREAVIKDVDAIITSLETLANELSEDLTALSQQLDSVLTEEYEMINEEEKGFLANIMTMVKSMKAYATLKSAYPKFKQMESDAMVDKIVQFGEFDLKADEMAENELEKVKEKYKEALQKVTDGDMPIAKKKATKEKIRQMRDEATKGGTSSTVTKKIEAARKKLGLQLDNVIRDAGEDLKNAVTDNPIESDIMSKRWENEKLEIDDKFALDQIDKETEAELQFIDDNPEAQERINAKAKKMQLAIQKESAEKKAELAADLKELEDEQDALAEKGDEKQKEANLKIKEFYKSGRNYITLLNSTPDDTKDLTPEEKKTFTETRKAYNAAKGAISPGTFKSSDPKLNDDDAEEMFTTFTDMVQKQVDEYKTKAATIKDEKVPPPSEPLAPENYAYKPNIDQKNSKEGMISRYKDLLEKAQGAVNEDKAKEIQDKMDKLSEKESWQIDGTELGRLLEMEISKLEMEAKLNENRYSLNSVRDRFSKLM